MLSKAAIAIVILAAISLAQNQSSTPADGKLVGVCAETNPGDKKITLECPAGTIVKKMKAAAWGQNPGSCPAVRRHSKCTLDITDFMERYCIRSNKCPVTVTKEILGFPVDKQGQECTPDETPFTFVASFYCGIAEWNDVPSNGGAGAGTAMDGNMAMDANDTSASTPAPETAGKPQRSSAMALSLSVATMALTLLAVIL